MKKRSPLSHVIAVFLSLFMLVFALGATGVGLARSLLSEDTVHRIIEEVDLTEIIYEALADIEIPNLTFTQDNVTNLLEDTGIMDFVADNFTAYIDALLAGEVAESITNADIMALIRENEAYIYAETGHVLTEEDFDDIEQFLYENEIEETLSFAAIEEAIQEALPVDLGVVRNVLSPLGIGLLAAAALLMAGLIFLVMRSGQGAAKCCAAYCGGVCLVTGVIYVAAALIGETVLVNQLPDTISPDLVESVFSVISRLGLRIGVPAVVLGAVLEGLAVLLPKRP
jgi:hypothetical protein